MSKFRIAATIPVVTYGNLMPEIEVEANSLEEAQAIALPQIESLWNKYVEPGKELRKTGQLIDCFVGGQVLYDDGSHTYSWNGETYLSGSQYAKTFEKEFDKLAISQAMAKKFKVEATDILAMWELKSEVSKGFGTAIHAAIELYERYRGLAETMEKLTHLHDHPIIKTAVEGFYGFQDENPAECEVVVVDHTAKRAGRIDRLVITGDKKCVIQDIKTNADITKSLPIYFKQLEFYRDIMIAAGWSVEALQIYHWNGDWVLHES